MSDEKSFILVVDDDAEMRSLLQDVLQDAGYQVETAASGREALKKLA
jgi:CheY-like chemotaxis protein